ncbi:MAG: zinc-ribbon domain-containing protein [Chloroflexi bacterium]|nr:zinc-ribbon domain-containing protein [Chloroflexota bacterium]
MITIIGMLLVAAAVSIVGWPLVRRRTASAASVPVEDYELSDLLSQREATYAAISELDADRQMGNLSGADHAALRQRYQEKAIAILKAIDEVSAANESTISSAYPADAFSDEIESEVLQIRKRKKPVGEKGSAGTMCWNCGSPVASEANFCSRCGAALSSVCPICGAQGKPEDRFCARCGASLELSRG